MSASSLAIPAASAVGVAAAPKRGAAQPDADFAAMMDAAPAVPETERPAAPAPRPAEDLALLEEPVMESVEPTGTEVMAAPVALPVVPTPPPAAPPPSEIKTQAAPEAAPPPVDSDVPAEPEALDIDADAKSGAQSGASPEAETDQIPARTPQAELPKAPAPATPVATPAPASAAVAAAAAAQLAVTKSVPEPKAETPRTRDVIDVAQSDVAEGSGTAASQSDTASAGTDADGSTDKGSDNPSRTATPSSTPNPSLRPAVEPVAAAVNTPVEVGAAPAPPVLTEARPVETAASLALSTLSHATIETTAQIAAQIVRRLESRSTRFEMALTPEGLGQVDVSMDIDNDGKLVARLAFDNPLAATEMRGRVDDLRRQLQEAGFTVADDALSFTERDPSSQFFGQGGAFDRRPDPRSSRAFGAASRIQADADLQLAPARWLPLALTPDRVDMKV